MNPEISLRDAYAEITRLRAEINRLKGELERVSRDAQIATDTRGETYKMLITRAEKAEEERNNMLGTRNEAFERELSAERKKIVHCENCGGSWYDDGLTPSCPLCLVTTERTAHAEAKRTLELDQKKSNLLEKYVEFLNKANSGPISLAWVHGWRCPQEDIDRGKQLRKELDCFRSQAKGGK